MSGKHKAKEHYVDNKLFLKAMTDWRLKYDKSSKLNRKNPTVTNYIGECFLKILCIYQKNTKREKTTRCKSKSNCKFQC